MVMTGRCRQPPGQVVTRAIDALSALYAYIPQ
jgi:hypothetical protein